MNIKSTHIHTHYDDVRTTTDDVVIGRLLDDDEVIALAVERLEEERRAAALELTARHDGDAVAQDVRLVHVVRRQQDGATLFVFEQQLPDLSARVRVDAGGRLVQDDGTRAGDERDRHRQLALHAARQTVDSVVLFLAKLHVANHSARSGGHL